MLALILTTIASLVPTILENSGVIGSKTNTLITNLVSPVAALLANLKAGNTGVQDALASLAAISAVVSVLKAETGLSPTVLTQIDNIDKDIQAALAKYVLAEGGYDATLYAQIAPVA